jgi:hypothetical protein
MQCQREKATKLTCSHSRAPKSKAKGVDSLVSHHSILFIVQIAQKHEHQTIQQRDCQCLENPLLAAHEKKLKFIIIKRSSGAYAVFPHLPLFRAHRGFENENAFHNTLGLPIVWELDRLAPVSPRSRGASEAGAEHFDSARSRIITRRGGGGVRLLMTLKGDEDERRNIFDY